MKPELDDAIKEREELIAKAEINKEDSFTEKQLFKQRVCQKFAPDRKDPTKNSCSGCKRPKEVHESNEVVAKWDSKTCTIEKPTDAFGKFQFSGLYNKTASYVKIAHDTDPQKLIQYMYLPEPKGWGLQKPNLIISVTGGAKTFTVPLKMKKAFKEGLVKAAASTGAWIITGGTNAGVMKLVGEAVADECNNENLVVIGVATWGVLAYRDQMIKNVGEIFNYSDTPVSAEGNNDDEMRQIILDSNHSHFIFCDDGSVNSYGKEIVFRANLEKEVKRGRDLSYYCDEEQQKQEKTVQEMSENQKIFLSRVNTLVEETIPMVLIVVNGGPRTLATVYESLKLSIPVLILADSKGAADLIAKSNGKTDLDKEYFKELCKEVELKIADDEIDHFVEQLKKINNQENERLINIFRLNNEEGSQDIELAILRTFLNARKDAFYENLKLALKWNRLDIAKSDILTGQEKFKSSELESLMEIALIENKPEFVELLLEKGIVLKKFLTHLRLYFLYNSTTVINDVSKPPIFQLLKMTGEPLDKKIITFKLIEDMFKEHLFSGFSAATFMGKDIEEKFLTNTLEESNLAGHMVKTSENILDLFLVEELKHPKENIFLWAVLTHRKEIAKIFWPTCRNQTLMALFASKILKGFAELNLSDSADVYSKSADEFENLAIGILDLFDKYTDNQIHRILAIHKINVFEIGCMDMAVEADCKKFLAHSTIQSVLTSIWCGKTKQSARLIDWLKLKISTMSFGTLAPFLAFDADVEFDTTKYLNVLKQKVLQLTKGKSDKSRSYPIKSSIEGSQDCCPKKEMDDDLENQSISHQTSKLNVFQWYNKRYWGFMATPKVRFLYNLIGYIAFLMLFNYMILCDFRYINLRKSEFTQSHDSTQDLNLTNSTTNTTEQPILTRNTHSTPSWSEFTVLIWIIALMVEEIRQFLERADSRSNQRTRIKRILSRLKAYLSDEWNYLDLFGCSIFVTAFILRLVSMFTFEILFTIARILLCIDLCIWYMKFLHVSLAFKSIGPKLVMIQKMIVDLMFFIFIILIFLCAIGVATHAAMYPENDFSFSLITKIFDSAYWPIFGDMKILENIEKTSCGEDEPNCVLPQKSGRTFSYLALMIYMIIVNVLLLNILIAMFSNTFESVQNNTNEIYKSQRYDLVAEYADAPLLLPPFNLLEMVYKFFKNLVKKVKRKDLYIENMLTKNDLLNLFETERKYSRKLLNTMYQAESEEANSLVKKSIEKLDYLEQKLNTLLDKQTKESNELGDSIKCLIKQFDTFKK